MHGITWYPASHVRILGVGRWTQEIFDTIQILGDSYKNYDSPGHNLEFIVIFTLDLPENH